MKFTFQQLYHVCSSAVYGVEDDVYRHRLDSYANYFGHNDDAKAADLVSQEDYAWIKAREDDFKIICCDFSMSENHPGGDDICDYVHQAIEAERAGFKVRIWYGDDSEVLIIGIRWPQGQGQYEGFDIDEPDAP